MKKATLTKKAKATIVKIRSNKKKASGGRASSSMGDKA